MTQNKEKQNVENDQAMSDYMNGRFNEGQIKSKNDPYNCDNHGPLVEDAKPADNANITDPATVGFIHRAMHLDI